MDRVRNAILVCGDGRSSVHWHDGGRNATFVDRDRSAVRAFLDGCFSVHWHDGGGATYADTMAIQIRPHQNE